MATASLVDVSLAVEVELDRIKRARPYLASRIDRAGHILTVHLSCPRQRMIKVRVRDSRARFLVRGSNGAIYIVDPTDWSCSCPDNDRSGLTACKHIVLGVVILGCCRAQVDDWTPILTDSRHLSSPDLFVCMNVLAWVSN